MKALYMDFDMRRVVALMLAKRVSRRLAFAPFSPLRFGDVPEPKLPGSRWLKVRNLACGLCGTDVHFAFMDLDVQSFPAAVPTTPRMYLGHELVGEVVEAGSEAGPEAGGAAVGDRVAVRTDWPSCAQLEISPPCRPCAEGSYMLCENGGTRPSAVADPGGGFSPFMVMHRSQLFRIPPGLTDDEALLLEPAACAVHAVMKMVPRPGQKVLVTGCGTIGLLTAAVARVMEPSCTVCCVARYPFQADQARRLGADVALPAGKDLYPQAARLTGARLVEGPFGNRILFGGFDIIFDAVGSDASLRDSLRLARAGGSVVLVGANLMPGRLDYSPVWYQEVNLVGVCAHATEATGETSFEIAARLLGSRALHVEGLITHRFPLEEYRRAIEAFCGKARSRAIKVVIEHAAAG